MRRDLKETPFGNLVWFVGVIEDINDPLKTNRVRVRCIGFHSDNKAEIPTDTLPWAPLVNTGLAASAPNFVNGEWVVGFFLDGNKAQSPVVWGTMTGIPSAAADPSRGFNDPNGVYPRNIGVPTNSELARNELTGSDPITLSRDSVKKGVRKANGGSWDEPSSAYNAVYPNNHVIETAGGHFVEIDDTSGAERLHVYHKAGTFVEMYPDGKTVFRSKGSSTEIVYDNKNIYISGDCSISADGNVNILSGKTTNIETGGDVNWKVGGKFTLEAPIVDVRASGSFNLKTGTTTLDASVLNLKSSGAIDVNAGGKLSFTSASVSASRGAAPLLS
jgi:hypothetical protein